MRHPHGSIHTKRQLSKDAKKDGGGKQRKKRAKYATVTDEKHGPQAKPGLLPQVRVPLPRNKREKYRLGSPFAKKDV